MSLIYYIIFFLILVSSLFEFFEKKKGNVYWYYTIVAIMALTAGLGYALSPDWLAYYQTMHLVGDIDWSGLDRFAEMAGMENGFIFLNKILIDNGFDFGMLTITIASLALILKTSTFYKYGGYPFLVLFLYAMPNFIFEEHVHIRQGLSAGFAVFSVRYIIDRNLWKFLLCIVIGYQFHEGIIVFVLAYWIGTLRLNVVTVGWLVTIAIIGNFTGLNSVIEIIMQFMPFGQDKFEDYQSQLYAESDVAVGDIIKILSVMTIIIYDKYAVHDKQYCVFRNLFIMGTLLYFFLGKGIFGVRLPGFYLVFLGLTLGRLLYAFTGGEFKKHFIYFSFVSYTVMLIFWFQIKQGHKSNFANYRTFFSEGAIYGIWKN